MTEVTVFMDEKFGFLNKIDIDAVSKSREDLPWFNQTLCSVNDCVVRVGTGQGEILWHKHDKEDEFFLVLSGTLFLDIEDGPTFELHPNEGCTVPKGVVHRTRAPERAVFLMVEGSGVTPTGD